MLIIGPPAPRRRRVAQEVQVCAWSVAVGRQLGRSRAPTSVRTRSAPSSQVTSEVWLSRGLRRAGEGRGGLVAFGEVLVDDLEGARVPAPDAQFLGELVEVGGVAVAELGLGLLGEGGDLAGAVPDAEEPVVGVPPAVVGAVVGVGQRRA